MIHFVPLIVQIVAGAIAMVFAAYLWPRSRVLGTGIIAWFVGAYLMNQIGFFPTVGVWSEGDLIRMVPFALLMSAPIVVYLWILQKRPDLRAVIEAAPTQFLIGSQVYRIVGATFIFAYLAGTLPAQMALPAAALDSFIGLSALPIAYFFFYTRPIAIGWNLIGLFDLALAISIVMLSLLGVLTLTPAPSAIGQAPSVLISLFQVPLAIIIHIELLRRELR